MIWARSCNQLLSYTKQYCRHWGYNGDADRQSQWALTGPQYARQAWEFSFSTGPSLIPSWLEGQKCLITAGWWWKPWSSWGLAWQHPIREGKKALLMPGRDGSPGFLSGPPGMGEEEEGGSVCHYCLVGMKIPGSYLSFSDATLAGVGVPWYSLVEGWSLGFPLGPCWHEWK